MLKICSLLLIPIFWSVQLSAQDISKKLDEHLTRAQANERFNGTILVAKSGKILLEKGYGYRDVATKTLHTPESILSIYSITKTFTAEAILELVEEGKVNLNENLTRFFPDLKHAKQITVRQLLSHTSGLYNYTSGPYSEKDHTEKSMIHFLNEKPLDFEPGSKFSYCNSGYTLLGFLAQKVEKKPFDKILEQRIFGPLGMKNSGFDYKNLRDPNKSTPYQKLTRKLQITTDILDRDIPFSGGAIYSTVADLYRYHLGITERKLLKTKLQDEAYVRIKGNYGLGWMQDTMAGMPIVWHSGGAQGFRTTLLRNEKENLCIAMLVNTETDINKLAEEVLKITLGQTLPLHTHLPISAAELSKYTGAFQDTTELILRFLEEDGKLKMKAPQSPDSWLVHTGSNHFFDESAEVPIAFSGLTNGKFDSLSVLTRRGLVRLLRKPLVYGIVGSATSGDWNGPDIPMTETSPNQWEARNVKLKTGELKLRVNNRWAINYGGELNQVWSENGPNLNVTEGIYNFSWNEDLQRLRLEKVK